MCSWSCRANPRAWCPTHGSDQESQRYDLWPPSTPWQKKDTDTQWNLQMMDMLHALQRGYTYQGGCNLLYLWRQAKEGGGGGWPMAKSTNSPESKLNFIVSQMDIIVNREHCLCVDIREREESIVETVSSNTQNLQGHTSSPSLESRHGQNHLAYL